MQVVLRLGCRAGHILVSKEEEPSDLYQHWLLSLLNLEGKIFFLALWHSTLQAVLKEIV